MPNVTVNPIQTVKVRVNQDGPKIIHNTTTFVGAADVQSQINQIYNVANNAVLTAQNSYNTANTAIEIAQNSFDLANTKLDIAGGTITGNLTVSGVFSNDRTVVDAGLF